ncbi:MAG TPA: hypothetical protein VNF73_17295 [Candidatus Saccharimonadales bacterium]|nr:hypothetical protein [Candidatus Saccharimonadales bacterium]
MAALGTDKKHAAGRLRWVLPAESGVVVRNDVPTTLVVSVIDGLLDEDAALRREAANGEREAATGELDTANGEREGASGELEAAAGEDEETDNDETALPATSADR